MRIALVIYGSLESVSGGYLYDRKLVEYLRAQGDTVDIVSLPWRNYAAHMTDNFHFRLPKNFNILIQDELTHPSLIAANSRKHPCPIISLVHHLRCSELRPAWQNWFYRIVEKKYLQSVDGFIFNSQTTMRVVNRLVRESKPSLVAHPPTDRFGDAISESEITTRAGGKEFKILYLGNVIYRKGLHTLLEAVSRAGRDPSTSSGQVASYELDVVGGMTAESKYVDKIKRQVSVNGLSSIVTFHGALDNDPLIEKLKQAHVLVVPSSYEGFGIVYLEGMGFGLPAIGTTAGAAGEIIAHGEDGYLIHPNDSVSLANHLDELARNRDLLVRLSLNAVKRYKSQPRWEESAKNIREFLYAIVKALK